MRWNQILGVISKNKDECHNEVCCEHEDEIYKCNEHSRTYKYKGGDRICLDGVIESSVDNECSHILKTKDSRTHVVMPGWIHLAISDTCENKEEGDT